MMLEKFLKGYKKTHVIYIVMFTNIDPWKVFKFLKKREVNNLTWDL